VGGRVGGDGEGDADVGVDARVGDLRRDADEFTVGVEECPTGLPWLTAASVWIAPVMVKP